jgi:hypothetical protein
MVDGEPKLRLSSKRGRIEEERGGTLRRMNARSRGLASLAILQRHKCASDTRSICETNMTIH